MNEIVKDQVCHMAVPATSFATEYAGIPYAFWKFIMTCVSTEETGSGVMMERAGINLDNATCSASCVSCA